MVGGGRGPPHRGPPAGRMRVSSPYKTSHTIMEAATHAAPDAGPAQQHHQRQTQQPQRPTQQQGRRRDAGRRHASFRDLKNLSVDDWCALFRIDRTTINASARDRLRWALSSLRERRYRHDEILELGEDMVVVVEGMVEADERLLKAPFFVNECVILDGVPETRVYRVASDRCRCYAVNNADAALLKAAGGFDADRTRNLRSFERRLALKGVDAELLRDDAIFAKHASSYLARRGDAEPLRFLVDSDAVLVMRDRPFVEVLRAFDGLWRVYARPWDAFADVSAVAGDATTRRRLGDERAKAVQRADAGRLVDAVAAIVDTVKRDLDTRFLPAFVASEAYAVFVRERFPGRGQKRVPVPRGEVLVAPAAVSTCTIS